jgi:hypothetical protein
MSVSGLQRLRKLQIGYQSSFASNTGATKVLPYRGSISIDPQLTDPGVDTGSLDPTMPPIPGAAEFTSEWEGSLAYNDAPDIWAGLLKGAVTPSTVATTGRQHIFQAASLTQDTFPYATYQWGDDVVTDWIHGGGSIIDEFTTGFDEDLGPWSVNFNTIHARASFGGPTGGLTVDSNPTWVLGDDSEVFLNATPGSIGVTRIDAAVHTAELRVTANNDPKRFAQGVALGSNTRFQLSNFGRGQREIELVLGVAKTATTTAERQTIDDAPPAIKYIELRSTSQTVVGGSTPYSQSIRMPMRLITAEDAEFGENNTGYTLTYRAQYDATLGYAIRVVTVTTNTTTYP